MDSAVISQDALAAIRRKFWDRYQEVKASIRALPQFIAPRKTSDLRSDIVFVDGYYEEEISSPPEGCICLPLDQAMKSYGVVLQNRFAKELNEEREEFAVLNGAIHQGLFLYVPPNTQVKPLTILSQLSSDGWMAPRLQIFLGKGSSLDLTEIHRGSGVASALIDIVCEENSELRILDVPELSEGAELYRTLRATLKKGARLVSLSKTNGAANLRYSFHIQLAQENSEVDLRGLDLLSKENQAHTNILIEHLAPHCRSSQHFKKVLEDKSRSSFEGKIYVHPIAQKTEAYQLNQNLLLSKDAFAKSLPNLEIFADDVKASHGATISQLDEEEIFYLRSRGLSELEAKRLLLKGFCQLGTVKG